MCPAHIHMLVEIPPEMSVAGYILGVASRQFYVSVRPLCALRRSLYHRALPASEIPPASPGDFY